MTVAIPLRRVTLSLLCSQYNYPDFARSPSFPPSQPLPMETIYEQKMESPVMITSGYQRFMVHGKNVANTGKPMVPVLPLSPADSASSQSPTSPSLTKRPSKTMRDWVKRSGSGSGRPTKHIATLSVPGHQRLPIVHLGGGRLGESDIEPAFLTGLRPVARNPSIQRESSADSRVTQWIDLYPEAIERMNGYDVRLTQGKHTRTVSESSTIKQTRWQFHPDHHAAAPPEIDARPAPLRIPSAKKKAADDDALKGSTISNTTTLARSDSKWKPLPILPAQQQAAVGGQHNKPSNALDGSAREKSGGSQTDSQDLGSATPQTPDPATVIPSFTPTSTITTAASTTSSTGSNISASAASALALTRKSPTPISSRASQDKSQTPPSPPPSTTFSYTRAERIWLHQHYRGEAPFLRAWGLDIKNLADREEGRVILRDLMLSEL
ncbi:hypothetical protein V8F33_012559 [Rhypophila sp. PSN 637]